MPRQARRKSKTGIYHVMLRGIDKRDIFLDDEDRMRFIESMIRAKNLGHFELYAHCLMINHTHMLMRETEEIGTSIKRITVSYAMWHNNKHGRVGHLFQDRYLSEPVETESYLVTVLRYIHQNPVKAGLVQRVEDYRWSSYNEYELAYQNKDTFIDAYLAKSYFKTLEDFNAYMNEPNSDECLDYQAISKITDAELRKLIVAEYKAIDMRSLAIKDRNMAIKQLYCQTGASIRQIARVLGVGKTVVANAIK